MSQESVVRPTPERMAKGDVIIIPLVDRENQHDRPARVEQQTTLQRYRSRKALAPWQLEAADKYHGQAARSGRFQSLTMRFEGRVMGGVPEMIDGQVAAGIARDRAIQFLAAIDHFYPLIVEHVCIGDFAAESWAIKLGFHPMKGIKTLRKALDSLCKHYGIKIGVVGS